MVSSRSAVGGLVVLQAETETPLADNLYPNLLEQPAKIDQLRGKRIFWIVWLIGRTVQPHEYPFVGYASRVGFHQDVDQLGTLRAHTYGFPANRDHI
jgi:hypothetical protein